MAPTSPRSNASCNLCGSDQYETIATRDRHGKPLETVICTDCGLVFAHPIPSEAELHAFYAHQYRRSYKGVEQPRAQHIYRSAVRALERLPQVRQHLASGRVLDIGSGGGEFVYLLQTCGYQALGVEPDRGYGGYSIREYGIDVRLGPFLQMELPAGEFDLITAHHVIEHVRDPSVVFAKAWSLLRPGGRFIVEVPNVESTYHAPHHKWHFAHIYNFNPVAMEAMGRKAGFSVVSSFTQPGTQHVNVTFAREATPDHHATNAGNRQRVLQSLRGYRNRDHYLSLMPLKRFRSNFSRWLHEQRAVRSGTTGKAILDAVYGAPQAERRAA